MKVTSTRISKSHLLFTSILLALLLCFSDISIGQVKIGYDKSNGVAKVPRVQQAFPRPNISAENNQIPETVITTDESPENGEIPLPETDAPLATRTASVSGAWSNTATWGGAAVPNAADAVVINSGITVTVDIANAQCLSLTMNRPTTGNTNSLNVNAGTLTCGSLIMLATVTTRNNLINITTGTLTVSGTTTAGTTGCQIKFSGAGNFTFGGALSGSPSITTFSGCNLNIGFGGALTAAQSTAITTVSGSNINYTSASPQTIYARTYSGNLGLSGYGTKTIAASATVTVNGDLTNSSTLVLTAGTSTTSTWLVMGGNLTNTGTITATGNYTRFMFNSANAQTFTNNGTVTSPLASFDVTNSHASGLTLAGSNGFVVARANLFTGTVNNSALITLGAGGATSAVVQRGVAANTSPAGSFNTAPSFNIGTGGLILLYDNGSVAYNTGYEVPASLTCNLFYIFDAADVTLNSDLIISEELNFYGGTGTPTLRIGTHKLTLDGIITYTVPGAFYGGTTSDLVLNSSITLNAVSNGLNNFTLNNSGGVLLGGAVTVNGTLTLNDGILSNGTNLTLASGTTISRSATGTLLTVPTFGTSVNVIYTGTAAVNSGNEIPNSSTVLNNLTTNTGGVTQSMIPSGGTVSSLYSQGFNATPADWVTEIVTNPGSTAPTITYVTSAASTYPAVTFTEGGIGIQFNSYDCELGDQIRLKKNLSPLATTGKTNITLVFDWYVDPAYSTSNDYVTVQWSLNGTTWNNSTSFYRYNATAGWVAQNCVLPAGAENQSSLYIAFLFTSAYGNNCHLDNLKVNVTTPGTPTPSTYTVNGAFDLTSGDYTIGSTNTLALNGTLSGSNALIGGTTSNLTVGGTGANLILPDVTNGLNSFTLNRPNGATLVSDLSIGSGGLTVTSGALTVDYAKALTVTGTTALNYTTSPCLILKSNATGTASFKDNGTISGTGTAKVERFITKYDDKYDKMFHLLSSPVASQAISPQFSDPPNNTTDDFYKFDESTYYWINFRNNLGNGINSGFGESNFVVGRGYLVAYNADANKNFTGSLNTGAITAPTLSYTASLPAANRGWNLAGNPYPSAIDWDLVAPGQYSNIDNAVYVYDNATPIYKTYVGGIGSLTDGIIPSMQGFFVVASAASPSLTLQNDDRVHATVTYYKNSQVENVLHLKVEGNERYDETFIRFTDDATPSFDGEWDAYKLYGGTSVPTFYTLAGDTKLSINSLPFSSLEGTVPLAVEAGAEATYTISLVENTMPPATYIVLEDLKTGIIHQLNAEPEYTFSAAPGEEPKRFLLHFKDITSVNEGERKDDFTVYNDLGVVNIVALNASSGQVNVIDMAGRKVATASLVSGSVTRIDMKGHFGAYIVNIITNKGVVNKKVVMN